MTSDITNFIKVIKVYFFLKFYRESGWFICAILHANLYTYELLIRFLLIFLPWHIYTIFPNTFRHMHNYVARIYNLDGHFTIGEIFSLVFFKRTYVYSHVASTRWPFKFAVWPVCRIKQNRKISPVNVLRDDVFTSWLFLYAFHASREQYFPKVSKFVTRRIIVKLSSNFRSEINIR